MSKEHFNSGYVGNGYRTELTMCDIPFTEYNYKIRTEDWVRAIIRTAEYIRIELCLLSHTDLVGKSKTDEYPHITWVLNYYKTRIDLHEGFVASYLLAGVDGVMQFLDNTS